MKIKIYYNPNNITNHYTNLITNLERIIIYYGLLKGWAMLQMYIV